MLRILVVDDNREFCESVRDILEAEGHEAITAYGGQTAVELAQKGCFDLILMDLVMPGMDGVATIKAIRKTTSVPITVVTAFGEESIVDEALQAGANHKLGKPLDFDKLLEDIASGRFGPKQEP